MDKSDRIDGLIAALITVQDKLPTIKKDEQGYGYCYSSLTSTIESTREILQKAEIAVIQLTTTMDNRPAVTTILAHSSGQYISTTASAPLIDMKGCNDAQKTGAVFSYLRRYGLQAILNIASEDNDAADTGNGGFSKPAGNTGGEPLKITEKQQRYLFVVARKNGWNEGDIQATLFDKFSIMKTEDLNRQQFDELLKTIQGSQNHES